MGCNRRCKQTQQCRHIDMCTGAYIGGNDKRKTDCCPRESDRRVAVCGCDAVAGTSGTVRGQRTELHDREDGCGMALATTRGCGARREEGGYIALQTAADSQPDLRLLNTGIYHARVRSLPVEHGHLSCPHPISVCRTQHAAARGGSSAS